MSKVKGLPLLQEVLRSGKLLDLLVLWRSCMKVKVYICDFYGCMLWDLGGDQVQQLLNCWSTCVKLAMNVPRATHTYFVDHLLACDLSSARVDIMVRYLKFFRGLLKGGARHGQHLS